MKFTENFLNTEHIKIQDQYVYLSDNEGREMELFIGEEVRNVAWTDDQLLVTLTNGSIRLYQDEINFKKI